jgi:hypothetical protein
MPFLFHCQFIAHCSHLSSNRRDRDLHKIIAQGRLPFSSVAIVSGKSRKLSRKRQPSIFSREILKCFKSRRGDLFRPLGLRPNTRRASDHGPERQAG